MGNLSTLTTFSATGNPLNGTLPASLSSLTSLTYLCVRRQQCSLCASPPSNLRPRAHSDLVNNVFSGTVPFLGAMTGLETVLLDENKFEGSLPAGMGALTSLKRFSIRGGNHFTGSIPDLTALTSLGHLDLYQFTVRAKPGGGLSGSLPPSLAACTALSFLAVDGNSLFGSIPEEVYGLTGLQHLSLRANGLGGELSGALGALSRLTALVLSDNPALRGSIPESVGGLTSLLSLYLSAVGMGGPLPEGLGALRYLQRLNLSRAEYSGTLPSSLSSLSLLADLELNRNSLSGAFPPNLLTTWTQLTLFRLADSGLCSDPPLLIQPTDGSLPYCTSPPPPSPPPVPPHPSPPPLPAQAPSPSSRPDIPLVVASALVLLILLLCLGLCARRRRRASKGRSDWEAAALLSEGLLDGDGEASGSGGEEDVVIPMGGEALQEEVVLAERLGEGGFGIVYAARWCGTRVAVKVLKSRTAFMVATEAVREGGVAAVPTLASVTAGGTRYLSLSLDAEEEGGGDGLTIMREVRVLSKLRHPNIVALYAFVRHPAMLVMQLAPRGSLKQLLAAATPDSLPWLTRLEILTGVACGVEYLHRQNPPVIHLDLKSANVLLDHELTPLVSDFGISFNPASLGGRRGGAALGGTPMYMCPELSRGEAVTDWEAVDSYGFGCICAEVCAAGPASDPTLDDGWMTIDFSELLCVAESSGSGSGSGGEAGREALLKTLGVDAGAGGVPAPLVQLFQACLSERPAERPRLADMRRGLEGLQRAVAQPAVQEGG